MTDTETQTPAWNDATDGRTEQWETDWQNDRRAREAREQAENWAQRTRSRQS